MIKWYNGLFYISSIFILLNRYVKYLFYSMFNLHVLSVYILFSLS